MPTGNIHDHDLAADLHAVVACAVLVDPALAVGEFPDDEECPYVRLQRVGLPLQ